VREALSNLATEFPAAQHPEFDAVGYRYRIVGFGWHQGWNDGGSTAFANEYEANLADLIDDLRAEFSQPALPVAIANSGFGGVGGQTGNRLTVRQAQDSIGSLLVPHPVYSGTVLTDDTAPYWRDAAVSPSNFGFHWNHNAETHYLIGKGMGEDMISLLP
jgi:alpha-galactosidase